MTSGVRVNEVDTIIGARRELAAELRELADRLDGQEPDYSALHDAWELLVEWSSRPKVYAASSSAGIPSRRLG
jgi:hypothetical protein